MAEVEQGREAYRRRAWLTAYKALPLADEMACQEVYQHRRAREWTEALTRWCDAQPDMLPFTGQCLVHRAEIMQLSGAGRGGTHWRRRAGPESGSRAVSTS